MDTDREEKIRFRAHAIWVSEGKPVGRDAEHWERARSEVEAEEKQGSDTDQNSRLPPSTGGKPRKS